MTLVEFVIALGLFAMVITGLFAVYWAGVSAYDRQQQKTDAQYMARQALEHMAADVRQASEVAVKAEGTRLHVVKNGIWVDYYLSGGQVYMLTSQSTPIPVAENISSLQFAQPRPDLVYITVVAREGGSSYTLAGSACQRER